jgi:transcriptional regulator with XRE-family HTH domain
MSKSQAQSLLGLSSNDLRSEYHLRLVLIWRLARNKLGLTQTEIGPTVNLDQSAVSRIEQGKQHVTADQLLALLVAAGLSPNLLLEDSNELKEKLLAAQTVSDAEEIKLDTDEEVRHTDTNVASISGGSAQSETTGTLSKQDELALRVGRAVLEVVSKEQRNSGNYLEEAKKLAQENGGDCLATRCPRIDSSLLWQCREKHLWRASLFEVQLVGKWCPTCAGAGKGTLKKAA